MGLGTPSTTGDSKNKEGGLDNHKSLRENKLGAWARPTDDIHLYKTILAKSRRGGCFIQGAETNIESIGK